MISTIEFLKTLPVMKGLTEDELERINRCIRHRLVKPGELLFNQGARSDGAYILRTGQVDVELVMPDRTVRPVTRLHPGRLVGELTLIEDQPRSTRVRGWMLAELLLIDRALFDALRRKDDPAAYKVIRNILLILCGRLRATNQQLAESFHEFGSEPAQVQVSRLQGGGEKKTSPWGRLRRLLVGRD